MSSAPTKPLLSSFSRWFQWTFRAIGATEIFLSGMSLAEGPTKMMSQFGIPESVIQSPHYADAMFWVLLHMGFIGTITFSIGMLVRDENAQRWFARIYLLFHLNYAFLDIRASDNPLGTGLYQGPASVVPAVLGCIFCCALAHLAIRSFLPSRST